MGRIFRKVVVRPLPAGAVVTHNANGTATARWTPRGARRPVVAWVVEKDGRPMVQQESPVHKARYKDHDGTIKEVTTGCKDEAAARQKLAQFERQAERI